MTLKSRVEHHTNPLHVWCRLPRKRLLRSRIMRAYNWAWRAVFVRKGESYVRH